MIVDLDIFMKPRSVKQVDVDSNEINIADCRQEGKIWCNLHLAKSYPNPFKLSKL